MTPDDKPAAEPQRIGPYRVLDALGVGGMGVVYLAEQAEPVRRRVALKVVKLGMDTKQVLARFESERQALAVMDHPNIARVLDGGMTQDGRPYFVMELVRGTPITDYADTHRLTTAERLRLFMAVCRAVQHAHQKGVIHRDIKPSNVLVTIHDGGPVVKVIDFGIAKAIGIGLTEQTLVTREGQILGTPEYMSPEQAEMSGLDVDTRTDVYSLGVLLYELIVGALPFDLRAQADYTISHTLREREPPRPSTRLTSLGETVSTVARYRRTTPEALRRELRGDLDWIILKSMDKDRTRRYDTANGLAMDVERHLNDEPVTARPPSAGDRIAKFVRRNRPAVLAATVATVALVGGATAATVGFVQARESKERAERAAATAEQVTDFLVDLFRVSDPSEARGSTITAREVFDRGAERIRTELADQPAVQARLMGTIGNVYQQLGLYDEAGRTLENAISVGERVVPIDEMELARNFQRLAFVRGGQGRIAEAERAARRALALHGGMGAERTVEVANVLSSLASVHVTAGRYAEAEALMREILAVEEAALGRDASRVAFTLHNLAALNVRLRRPEEVEPLVRRAIAITERDHGPDHARVGSAYNTLGAAYYLMGRYAEAETAYSRSLAITERTLGPDHPTVAATYNNLAEILLRRGDHAAAEAQVLRSLAIKERALGPNAPAAAVSWKVLGNVYREQGRLSEADSAYRRALSIYDATLAEPDDEIREALEAYAELLRRAGRPDEAAAMETRAAAIMTARGGER